MAFTGCPNTNAQEWKDLVKEYGEKLSSSLFHRNNGVMPTVDEAKSIIKASKIGQFKKAISYLQATTSGQITDLLPNLFKIVQKLGDDLYVVKGASLDQTPARGADFEIHQANIKFLQGINKEFGPIFNIDKVDVNPEISSLKNNIVSMLKTGQFKDMLGLTMKQYAENPEMHNTLLETLSEQVKDPEERASLRQSFGDDLVDKLMTYNGLTGNEEGLPEGRRLFNAANPETALIAQDYKKQKGILADLGTKIKSINTKYSKRVADAFHNMTHNPTDPQVRAAYKAMASETLEQYSAIQNAGYKIELFDGQGEPYKNSAEMTKDVRENKHLFVLPTNTEFGSDTITDEQRSENPLLGDSGITDVNDKPLLVNDVFRFVHDFFGHTERGNSFGPIGEENAWDAHSRMYSELARRAMTTETRGQNSWVNFGEHLRNAEGEMIKKGEEGYVEPSNRPFAPQKIGLLPEEFSNLAETPDNTKVVPSDDTYRVTVNQDALNDLATKNIDEKAKNQLVSTESTLANNDAALKNKAPQYGKASSDAQVSSVNRNVLNYLRDKFNLPFEVVNDPNSDWRGKFENGKITINAARMNEWTALHEYTHPFIGAMEKDNVELYNNLVSELTSNEEGKETLENTKQLYPELSVKEQVQEALVEHISKLASNGQIKERPWYTKLMDWFREMFSKNGISIADLDMNMKMSDIADKIIDPAYTADLKRYYDFNDAAVQYQKDNTDNFDQIVDKIKTKLKLDSSISPKSEDEKTRKYHSARQLKMLEDGKDVYKAINDYVTGAIISAKKISDKFDQWRDFYEANKNKITPDKIKEGAKILSEMENHQVLYKESRFVIDAIREQNPEEYEDNFSLLANRLNKDTKIINNYNEYGLKIISDWLYPSMKREVEGHIKNGTKSKMPGYEDYLKVKKDNPNLKDEQAVEMGVKKWIKGQMQHATSDVGFFNSWVTGVLNSKDPISQLVALTMKHEMSAHNEKLFRVKNGIKDLVNKAVGTKLFTTNEQHKQFYGKYLREVNHREKTGVDDKGNPTYGYVKRMAFHEPYKYDEFYNKKREFFEELGARPNKNDEAAYKKWEAAKDTWFDKHSVRVFNDRGEVIKTNPAAHYTNPEYAAISKDPLFAELYKHYQDSNGKLEQYQLKYGIIPQKPKEGSIFSDLKLSKGLKGNAEAIKKAIKGDLGAELGTYYAQDIDGREYKNVPIQYTRMVDNDDLDYNLGQSVADFWESSAKYETAKNMEPMVLTLRSFIEGNAALNVAQRDAPEVDAKGVKKMGKFVKNVLKTKDQANINRQLIDFVNDTVYGDAEKKANIKSPFLNLKYLVYKDGDTSANGKPHKEYVYSLEDLKQKTGNQNIEYDHFTKGTEKQVGDHKVTLLSNDKIVSVNKIGRKLNTLSAAVNLGINVTAGTSHLLRGVASNFIEATGGKYFNNKEWGSAYKDYFKRLVDFSFMEDVKGGKGSLISQHLSHYGTFQGEFLDEYGHKIGQGVVNKLFRRSAMFFSLHGAEHLIQTTQMLAAMKHIKVEDGAGKLIGLDKAYEIGKDGYRTLKPGVKWSEEQDNNFKDTLQSINKDRGNYSEFDKAGISRLWWGKMLIMFRRHIMNGIKTRFGSDYVDYERGNATQGYYRSFMTTLVSEYNEFRLNGKFRKLTPDEQYHAKKTLADLGLFAALATVIVPSLKNKDQHDPDTSDYMALFARRLQMDVSFYINPLEWKKIIQSPVVTGNSVDKIYDFLHQATISPSEEYQKDGSGYRAGDNKALHKLGKIIPGYREFVNLQDPQDLLKFYDLDRSGGGGK